MSESVLVVRVGAERVAFALAAVRELVDAPAVLPSPMAPPAVLGQVELRGQYLPLLDLAPLLGIPREGAAAPVALLMADGGYAFAVDDAADLWAAEDAALRPAPAGSATRPMLRGVLQRGTQVAGLVDLPALHAAAVASLRAELPT